MGKHKVLFCNGFAEQILNGLVYVALKKYGLTIFSAISDSTKAGTLRNVRSTNKAPSMAMVWFFFVIMFARDSSLWLNS